MSVAPAPKNAVQHLAQRRARLFIGADFERPGGAESDGRQQSRRSRECAA